MARWLGFVLVMVFATSLVSNTAIAQFRISEFSPQDGSANVPLAATIRFTFSEPVDTSATWPDVPDFFLDLKVTPDPWDGFTGISISPDLMWIDIFVTLKPDTQYWWVVKGGRALSGAGLSPFSATFTTGPELLPFSVLATDPPTMTAGISTGTTMNVVFSAPLDTLLRFPASPFYYFDAEVFPPADSVGTVEISDDLTAVRCVLFLREETQYWITPRSAKSFMGLSLVDPQTIILSTGLAIYTGEVSGTVVGAGMGTRLALDTPARLFSGDSGPGYPIMEAGGSFRILGVPDGRYVLGAFPGDENTPGPEPGGLFGFHDPDRDHVADIIAVGNGETVTGIGVILEPFVGRPASYGLSAGASILAPTVPDARPVSVFSEDVMADGSALVWIHGWRSATGTGSARIVSLGPWHLDMGPSSDNTPFLPDGVLDSGPAIAVAEAAGGAVVRPPVNDGHVSARLSVRTRAETDPPETARALWAFEYAGPDTVAMVLIDAVSGLVVANERIGPVTPSHTVLGRPYPNPAAGVVSVPIRIDEARGASIGIYDVLGRLRQTYRVERGDGEIRVETDGLAPGVYFIRMSGAGQEGRFVLLR